MSPLVEMQSLMSGGCSFTTSREGRLALAPVVARASPGPAMPSTESCGTSLATAMTFCALPAPATGVLAHDAGTAFVGAIIFAVAVVALDVARRRDRHMHAREIMMVGFFGIAGMVLHLVPDFGGHVVRAVGGAATGLALATAGAASTGRCGRADGDVQGLEVRESDRRGAGERGGLHAGILSRCRRPQGAPGSVNGVTVALACRPLLTPK